MSGRIILINLKRLAGNKVLLFLLVIAPVVLMAIFAAVIAPVFYSGGLDSFEVAVVNGDSGPLTGEIVRGLMQNEKTRGLITARFASSQDDGMDMLMSGAAALITIPEGFQDTLESGGQGRLTLRLNPSHAAQGALLRDVLRAGVDMVNDAQGGVYALYDTLIAQGMSQEQAGEQYNKTAREFLVSALDRGASIQVEGELSPLGSLLPVEYYASALLAVFLFLSAMAIAGLAAEDISNCVLDRHLSSGRRYASYAMTRVFSGALLVLMQGVPAIGLVLFISSSSFAYSGSALFVVPALVIFAFAVSAGGVFAGTALRKRENVITAVFFAIAAFAMLGGAVIPASGLGALSWLAPYTPVGAAMRLFSTTLFYFDSGEFTRSLLVTAAYAAALCTASVCICRRRV